MRILVIGGTRFVGKHLVAQALGRGHDVTLFHRGRTGAELFPEVEHRLGAFFLRINDTGRNFRVVLASAEARSSAMIRKSADARHARSGRSV
mgnify:CR=1 FL=1